MVIVLNAIKLSKLLPNHPTINYRAFWATKYKQLKPLYNTTTIEFLSHT